jgi:hypothetical protein
MARGQARSNQSTQIGYIRATGIGSVALGRAFASTAAHSLLDATGVGAMVEGYALGGGTIEATSLGSFAQGHAVGGGSTIKSSSHGSFAQGKSAYSYSQAGYIGASGLGSFAQGFADGGSISAISGGFAQGISVETYYDQGYSPAIYAGTSSFAQGWAGGYYARGGITSGGAAIFGCFAQGLAYGQYLESTGKGSFAQGYAAGGGDIKATGKGAFAQGEGSGGDILATADGAVQFSAGTNATTASLQIGDITGSGVMLEAAGHITSTGARILGTTRVTGTYIILVTDHQIFCDTDGGAFTVTLPAGVAGQEFRIMNTGTSANNLTIAPNGAELLIGVNGNSTVLDGTHLHVVYESTEGWA